MTELDPLAAGHTTSLERPECGTKLASTANVNSPHGSVIPAHAGIQEVGQGGLYGWGLAAVEAMNTQWRDLYDELLEEKPGFRHAPE